MSFVAGVMFLLIGAWPVFGFLGLDVLLIYWAFRINYRAARAYEEVTVTASELTVRKVSHRGSVREWTLNPLWVRLERVAHEEFGIERLFLISHGRRLSIAGLPGAGREGEFRGRAFGRAGRSQARPDANGAVTSANSAWCEQMAGNLSHSPLRYTPFASAEIGWLRCRRRPRWGAE